MRTIVLGPRPAELDALIARRQALGQDTHDEVWEGEYHMAPAAHPWHAYLQGRLMLILDPYAQRAGLVPIVEFNLGEPNNFRVPDGGLHRGLPGTVFVDTAAMVIEVLSPDDETWQKFDHYAAHAVDEIMVVDLAGQTVQLFTLAGDTYDEVERSALLDVAASTLAAEITWPG